MATTLFISDLHLCEERPQTTALFTRFVDESAIGAAALYILGDLFEYWIGDDQLDHDPMARAVAQKIAACDERGTRVFFMHGNRDFLIGERFATETGLTILPDPTTINLGDKRILLMHGDTLCSDDIAYQRFRTEVRDPDWQRAFLARPYAERDAIARVLRTKSSVEKSMKAESIMDVNVDAIEAAARQSGCDILVHGHTHRPARHEHTAGARSFTRWVLHDWHQTGGYLCSDDHHWFTGDVLATCASVPLGQPGLNLDD